MKKILVTGCAGFIGNKLLIELVKLKKYKLYGIDNINNYYSPSLKKKRLNLINRKELKFYKLDITNKKKLLKNFKQNKYDYIFHLAAQAGVRYSIENPQKYFDSNIKGFFNILEACRFYKIKILFFASSSSVYGDQKKIPLRENFNTDKPRSFYAATKKCNEVMAYSYSTIYKLNTVSLRFFTVYGPFGRPDMTPFSFLNQFYKRETIKIFNYGNHQRDFTFIEDTINFIILLFKKYEKKKKLSSHFEIFNIARGKSEKLINYIDLIENLLGKKIKKKFTKVQSGDVEKTFACTKKIKKFTKYKTRFDIKSGVSEFLKWYKSFYKINN